MTHDQVNNGNQLESQEPLLQTKDLTITFGGLTAVSDVTLTIRCGQIFGIIGPNGAGKTTLLNAVTGLVTPTNGHINFKEQDITDMPTWQRARVGMSRTFQNLRLFEEMTVFQTVLVGRHAQRKNNAISHLLGLSRARLDERSARRRAWAELEFVDLVDRRDELVKNLPYGHRRRVEIARALVSDPDCLLLDEPAAGMNPQECDELVKMISRIHERGITVGLVEHHMRVVMAVCDRIAVLNYGAKVAEGTPVEVRSNPAVIEAYLGKGKRGART